MATFVAQVKDTKGNISKRKVDAASPEQARMILRQQYAAIGSIKPAGGEINLEFLEALLNKVSVKDMAVFSRQFSVMINAGVAIVRCLGVLSEQCPNPKLKKALVGVSSEVQQGTNLSESLAKYPDCFDQLYVSMVEAGETGGVLDEVLNRLSKLLEDMARLQNQIKSAMAYPVAVGLLAVVAFLGMTIFLIPVFAKIFQDLGTELPALTQFMLDLSDFLRSPLAVLPVFGIAGAVFAFKKYYATPAGRLQVDGMMLKIPLFGPLNEKVAVARFCRVFGTLTRSGVPIMQSLEIVCNTIPNKVIANAIADARSEIQQGGVMSLALQRSKVFPSLAIQMISIGEETGELDAMMMKVADFYEDEVEQTVKALTSIIEPVMMVFIAGMVGTILLSMYLPMFKIFEKMG
ncbi:MAG: type II secretion system F family protein [Snowella sp.]|nr:type II secretion system F family protein [Snowella sp.]